jgi:serine/threonine protein phosphatase PrpC
MVKKILNYDFNKDQEIYISEKLDSLGVDVSTCTVAGVDEKPNEDAFVGVVDDGLLWLGVIDGTTSLKQLEKLKRVSGARFSSHFLAEKFSMINTREQPGNVLLNLNKKLLKETIKLAGKLEDTHSLPASVGTLIKLDFSQRTINMAHAGDTYCVIYYKNGDSEVISDDRNKKFDDEMFSLIKQIAQKEKITNREARQREEVKEALVGMYIKRNNNPNGNGSGLVNGDPSLEKYILSKEISFDDVSSILIASDGLEIQGKLISDSKFRDYLYNTFNNEGLKKIIKDKKDSEDKDPDWKHIRYKHSDDATAIFLNFHA